jgi:hypothetical protein
VSSLEVILGTVKWDVVHNSQNKFQNNSQNKFQTGHFSTIGCNCSNVFDYFFHVNRIHYHRDTKLKNTLWGWVDADWDGDREDEGQLGYRTERMGNNYHYITETRIQVTSSQLSSWIFQCSSVSGLSIQISTSTQDHTEKESTDSTDLSVVCVRD